MSSNKNSRKQTMLTSLNESIHRMMKENKLVIVIGEDIADPYGGAFKVTQYLSANFPERVFTTPISEAAITGIATGMAIRGFLPIAEIMFGDFLMLAGDQLVNHASKFRWMYNDGVQVPAVFRTPVGGRRGYGPTHSQCLEKHFLGVPGLLVVAPHIIDNPGSLLELAVLTSIDPVLFLESKACYGRRLIQNIPGMHIETFSDNEFFFPTTYIYHQDVSSSPDGILFCYGPMVPICLEAIQKLRKQESLFINLAIFTQLSPPPVTHIRQLIAKNSTSLFIYGEEASSIGGWGAEMIAQVEEIRSEDRELSEIMHCRIGAKYTPIGCSHESEKNALPQVDDIIDKILLFL